MGAESVGVVYFISETVTKSIMQNLKLKIDVTKILKEHLFSGKSGAKYLDIVLWENRDGVDQYGNTHRADQDLPKEARDKGAKGPILGNAKPFGVQAKAATTKPTPKPKATADDMPPDDVPF